MTPVESDNSQLAPQHFGDPAGTVSSDNSNIADLRPQAPPTITQVAVPFQREEGTQLPKGAA